MTLVRLPFIVSLVFTLAALPFAGTSSVTSDSTTKTKSGTPQKQILFFMNPNGRPCQMQKAILDEIKDSLAPLAAVKYYKTTVEADLSGFDRYGIRGLPSLIIADPNGRELSRFPPGIQSSAVILKALRSR
jgi:hypothetical protein